MFAQDSDPQHGEQASPAQSDPRHRPAHAPPDEPDSSRLGYRDVDEEEAYEQRSSQRDADRSG